jgi:hypothetical protein
VIPAAGTTLVAVIDGVARFTFLLSRSRVIRYNRYGTFERIYAGTVPVGWSARTNFSKSNAPKS